MDKVTILVRTIEDCKAIKVFPNTEKAKEYVLNIISKRFKLPNFCTTFASVTSELVSRGFWSKAVYCGFGSSCEIESFEWSNNGFGEKYVFLTFDINNNDCFKLI